jgi:hypothetical protein
MSGVSEIVGSLLHGKYRPRGIGELRGVEKSGKTTTGKD